MRVCVNLCVSNIRGVSSHTSGIRNDKAITLQRCNRYVSRGRLACVLRGRSLVKHICFIVVLRDKRKEEETQEKNNPFTPRMTRCLICPSLYQFFVLANSIKGSGHTVTETVGTETAHYTIVQSPSHSFVVISPLPSSLLLSRSLLHLPLSLSCMFFSVINEITTNPAAALSTRRQLFKGQIDLPYILII